MQDFEHPIVSEQEVEDLIHIKGIGESTVSMLMHVQQTGYIDYLDDLYAQIEVRHQWDQKRLSQLSEIGERVERMNVNHARRRALLRTRARDAFTGREEYQLNSKSRVKTSLLMEQGNIVTGAQRRKMIQSREGEGDTGVSNSKREVLDEFAILTRTETRRQRFEQAVRISAEASDNCAICLEEYTDEEQLEVFDCKHCFHVECMQQWLETRFQNSIDPNCPLCRRPIAKSKNRRN